MGKGRGGALGALVDQFIYPLLFIGNAAIFVIGLAMMVVGGYLIVGQEKAAATAAIVSTDILACADSSTNGCTRFGI